jgi:hypothetical protein
LTALLVAGALLAGLAPVADTLAAQRPGIRITPVTATAGGSPAGGAVLRHVAVLDDASLEEAVRSGLPLRLQYRVELWRAGFFDNLTGHREWTTLLVFDPLRHDFIVRDERAASTSARRYRTYAEASAVLERDTTVTLLPGRSGRRYYYTASLEIGTLSLSDIEELERWLQGELQPSVSGERGVGSALGQGAKRVMMRLLRLPSRRYEARSPHFVAP